jgi:hypothetical protein
MASGNPFVEWVTSVCWGEDLARSTTIPSRFGERIAQISSLIQSLTRLRLSSTNAVENCVWFNHEVVTERRGENRVGES